MPDIIPISCIVAAIMASANLYMGLRRNLMMLQQNSYRRDRFNRWIKQSGEHTSMINLIGWMVVILPFTKFCPPVFGMIIIGLYSAVSFMMLCRRKYKKPLVMTARARRIFVVAVTLIFLISAFCAAVVIHFGTDMNGILICFAAVLVLCFICSDIITVSANSILAPVEKAVNRRYIREAERILEQMPDLKIIGVTGSYGKTTTKHYLCRILSEQFETVMTPGSFNTTLGVVRTIRESLKPYHEIFIVEMGAKARGDIAEICDIVHPSAGIITAVGPQHLESFKTIENVQAAKFELADALPADGIVVVNDDFPRIADRHVDNARCIRYAVKNIGSHTDYIAENIEYSPSGTTFTVKSLREDWSLVLRTPLVGECNISNVLAAVVVAKNLGMEDSRIAYAVERLEQVEHRLSIKRVPGGLTIVDDAFNSNPVGSAMALDVLAAMKTGKRILVTPGMIELGDRQEALNTEFGCKAASCADVVIVVGQYNRDAIVAGLNEGGMPAEAIHKADSFAHAQQILASLSAPGDTVLYENDLPDTFK